MRDQDCVTFLQWALPRLDMRWPGFRKVRKQVCKRIARRIGELGLVDTQEDELHAYRSYLEAHDREWAVLDGFCRITISRFRRDHAVWDALIDTVLPELAAAGDVRAWSVGCASGEEPYTLSLVWQRFLAPRFPATCLRILATDADPVVRRWSPRHRQARAPTTGRLAARVPRAAGDPSPTTAGLSARRGEVAKAPAGV